MEHQLYQTVLLLAGSINFLIACVLLYNNVWFRNYDVYRRACQLVAICYTVFGIGFYLHAQFELRTLWPAAASALSVSYFHIGGVLFGWSHTSLMRPDYLTRRVAVRDLALLIIGLLAYWSSTVFALHSQFFARIQPFTFIIFFVHAGIITYTFYHTYYVVRRNIMRMPAGGETRKWWTPQTKRTVLNSHHSFMISGHLIILFGIGGIVFTAAFPTQIAPYTLLSGMGILVYCYIFYALTEYGNVIEAATCATEDAGMLLQQFPASYSMGNRP